MKRRAALATAVLVGCGGGGGAKACAPGAIAFYANSVGTSYLIAQNTGGIERLSIPFARSLQAATGRPVLDYSCSGATAHGLLAGAPRMSIGPFAQHVRTVPADVVLILLGGVEAVFPNEPRHDPMTFGSDLGRIFDDALAAGKKVAAFDVYRLAGYESAADAINERIDAVAGSRGVKVIVTRDLPVRTDDGVHPNEQMKDEIVRRALPVVAKLMEGP